MVRGQTESKEGQGPSAARGGAGAGDSDGHNGWAVFEWSERGWAWHIKFIILSLVGMAPGRSRVPTESDWEPARDLVKIYRVIKKEEKGVRLENTLRIKTNEWRSLV